MRIESKLCHLSENKAVVLVNGWLNDQNVGSALGEGSTVELAEDNAISRLNKRIQSLNNNEVTNSINEKNNINIDSNANLIKTDNIERFNSDYEPNDWSNELTAIDAEIKRLKWNRDDEIEFLESIYGYNNRNKITKYSEIKHYLNKLKNITISNSTDVNRTNREIMIKESDALLHELSWDHKQGREYLQKEFNVSTRKELDQNQLMLFINKLKILSNHD